MQSNMPLRVVTILLTVALSISVYYNFSQSTKAQDLAPSKCGRYQFTHINSLNRNGVGGSTLYKIDSETGLAWILIDRSSVLGIDFSWVKIKN